MSCSLPAGVEAARLALASALEAGLDASPVFQPAAWSERPPPRLSGRWANGECHQNAAVTRMPGWNRNSKEEYTSDISKQVAHYTDTPAHSQDHASGLGLTGPVHYT